MIFLASQWEVVNSFSSGELLLTLVAGFRLDFSTASYVAVIPFLLYLILIAGGDRFIQKVNNLYYGFSLIVVILLSVSNITIYKFWGTLLNNRGLAYAMQPTEMFASVTGLQIIFLVTILVILISLAYTAYKKFLVPSWNNMNGTTSTRLIASVLLLPVIGIGIRGGIQLIPVNESSAYFSEHRILNNIAVNNIWYLGHNLKQSDITENNPYKLMDDDKALQLKSSLYDYKPGSVQIFDSLYKPNVVIILLESWTADIIEPLGGLKEVTPFFSSLCEKGLLFSNVYSSGFRTDQALVSVLSGYPAQPNKSIIRFPDKTAKLPSLANEFKKAGYVTSFFYGGELGFANMYSYLVTSGFEKIKGKDAFATTTMNSKWGAHDEFVLNKQLEELNGSRQPFFSTLLTLSTHEPFEVPVETPFNDPSESEQFKKSAWYADYSLKKYFEKASVQPWFNNTIFVLVADHGHRLPLNRDYYDPLVRKIPLLIFSPLLRHEFRGTTMEGTSNQNDLASTLLESLGLASTNFEWSNNLLAKNRQNFAYISLDEAFTWVTDSSHKTILLNSISETPEPFEMSATAYLQALYRSFLTY